MGRTDRTAAKRVSHDGVLGLEEVGVAEGVLDAALRHATGRRVLRDHRPMDRLAMLRLLADIVVEQPQSIGEEGGGFRFERRDASPFLHPGIEQRLALIDAVRGCLHPSSIVHMFEGGRGIMMTGADRQGIVAFL